jgi:tyrosyl-tRNA synthetase
VQEVSARCTDREAAQIRCSEDPGEQDETHVSETQFLDELQWRGLVALSTDEAALREAFAAGPVTFYVGFDPTGPSLHHGHLVQVITARRLQQAGHRPLALVGGSTGLIGDPRPTSERVLNAPEVVAGWVDGIRAQIEPFLSFDGDNAAVMVNNLDWTAPMSAIDLLRDIGKHFRVNKMITKDAVAARLNSQEGISYTEFSYQILQGLDFLELYRRYGCTLQFGGSDQWGNLTAGLDLIHRTEGGAVLVHAFATPLLTRADGTKFSKSEGNALWLSPELTSPYAFYQFWVNTDDRDVATYLRVLSFRSREEIEALEKVTAERPAARVAQRALADELTALVHGEQQRDAVVAASQALFGRGELSALDAATLRDVTAELPSALVRRVDGEPLPSVLDLLTETGLSPSRSAARRAVAEGGAYVNNQRVTDEGHIPVDGDLLAGRWLLLRHGKRHLAAVEVVDAAADLPGDAVAML